MKIINLKDYYNSSFVGENEILEVTDEEYVRIKTVYSESQKQEQRLLKAKKRHETNIYYIDNSEKDLRSKCDLAGETENHVLLEKLISQLTPTQKRRFTLYYIYGHTYRQIADIEHVQRKSVSDSINQVKEKIKIFFS